MKSKWKNVVFAGIIALMIRFAGHVGAADYTCHEPADLGTKSCEPIGGDFCIKMEVLGEFFCIGFYYTDACERDEQYCKWIGWNNPCNEYNWPCTGTCTVYECDYSAQWDICFPDQSTGNPCDCSGTYQGAGLVT